MPRDEMFVPLRSLASLITLVLYALSSCHARITNQEIVTMTDAEAVVGEIAELPCDVKPPLPGDKLHLVIWYKEEADAPIYSFDMRGTHSLDNGNHWQDQSLKERAFFKHSEPAKLVLKTVRESDAAVYRCRVDFKQSPTRNSKVNLTVIIPPEQLSILDEDGRSHIPHYILGPYTEGASLNLTCVAAGGRPQPRVTWWQGTSLLDSSYETVDAKRVRNVLQLEKLGREHLRTYLTCQATNNNMIAPITSSVTLDMNLKPLWVRIQGENRPLSAGKTYEIGCEVVGARPEPTITWSKGNTILRNARETRSPPDGNVTTSVLTFVPSIEDAGKFLYCRASVPDIPDSEMEQGWKLNIYHEPVVTLELGSNLNSSAIREGIDVYFECNIKSNPWVYKVSWRHNGNPLYHNPTTGTIISNQSLVLQSVTRSRAGIYTCIGNNQEGDGESNPLNLDIKFAPVCQHGQTRVFGVAKHESANIPCELEANPPEVSFTWKFNNTMEAVDIPQAKVISDRTHSTVSYEPINELDYGTLLCWGNNDQGSQLEPCVFHIVPAGERLAQPPSPENCTIREESRTTVRVSCAESEYFDANTATYVLQVFDADTRRLLASATSLTPSMLEVTDLPADRSHSGLVLSLRIMTAHAMSDATLLHSPHFVPEGNTQEHQRYPALTPVLSLSGPLLGAVVGATAGLLLVIFVIVLAVRLRYRPRSQEDSHDDGGMANLAASGTGGASSPRDKSSTLPLSADSIESFEKNPDIIPHANENSYAELCKGTSPRYVLQQPRPDTNTFVTTNNQGPELTYAELTLRGNRRIPPNCYQPVQISGIQRPQLLPMSTLTRRQPIQEPTIYAQVASHSKPIYVPPPHPYMNRPSDETTAETPLIGHDNKITTISHSNNSIWRTDTPPCSNAPTT
ncbi:hemicentin-2-like isoform X1 [Formica exsecta]|uniref:hemicentin-2-like isoform X1 n=1 Tax=Formica exsecta TaxID=72781 RepID=UPI001144CB03|nr:hemicentin-2-like isoform X1 [Formica exsecta]